MLIEQIVELQLKGPGPPGRTLLPPTWTKSRTIKV